jgi:hypothetical protein
MERFTTKVDLEIFDSYGFHDAYAKTRVTWSLDLEMREYGVKSILIIVPDQKISLSHVKDEYEGDLLYDNAIEIEITDIDDIVVGDMSTIIPKKLTIIDNKATLEF